MDEPNFQTILKGKTDYYGKTEAAYEFAAEEYARQLIRSDDISERIIRLEKKVNKLERPRRIVMGAP